MKSHGNNASAPDLAGNWPRRDSEKTAIFPRVRPYDQQIATASEMVSAASLTGCSTPSFARYTFLAVSPGWFSHSHRQSSISFVDTLIFRSINTLYLKKGAYYS